ncbi:hypothetical protein M2C68_18350 [Pseudomonas sp. BAgro211]|nr:hypothetical protein [Pseudomonas sp. BAgro211]
MSAALGARSARVLAVLRLVERDGVPVTWETAGAVLGWHRRAFARAVDDLVRSGALVVGWDGSMRVTHDGRRWLRRTWLCRRRGRL